MATAAAAGASTSAARSEAKASSDATSTSGGDNVGDSSIVRTQFTSSEYFIAFTLSIYRSTKAARAHASAKDKGKGKRKSNGGAGDESLALSSATSSSRGKVQATAAMAEGAIGFGLAALFGDAGAGEMGFELLSFDASSSSGIIGIDAKYTVPVCASLALMTEYAGYGCSVEVTAQAGSLLSLACTTTTTTAAA